MSDNAVSGLDHEPLTPRHRSLLRGSQRTTAQPEPAEDKLTGDDLAAAVKDANEAGADIKVSGTADERRAALAEWTASQSE